MTEQQKVDSQGIRVFVYGSLKQGRGNHSALSGADLLGRCVLRGPYRMVDLHYYPGLVMTPTDKSESLVLGEVYRISKGQLDMLDMIEGHPDYYCRHKVQTPWKGAWAYFLPHSYLAAKPSVEYTHGTQIWLPTDEEVEWARERA